MCGINGIFAYKASAPLPGERELLATRDHMRSRGPDGAGAWWSSDRRLGLGHRRLSIIDLSDRASQPMASDCGRYVVVFNGEIYNYPALRRELEAAGRAFRTDSDTEVLLHLFQIDGVSMVHRLRGMFAFAIWDDQDRKLFLARDAYGIKPLYTAADGHTFRFASQVKALLAGGGISRDADTAGIVGFHIWGSVPEPFTLYRQIRSLPAGHTQVVDGSGARDPIPYVSIAQLFANGAKRPVELSQIDLRVRQATLESVRAHLLADVEVGVFLSAGVDSGAILGLTRDAGQEKIRAITLSFEEFQGTQEDEVPLAAEVARTYGAEHIVRTVSEREFRADLPEILEAMDQPSIDGINSWFVAKASREAGLKVALTGTGGDELFAGYSSFHEIPRWVSWLRFPSAIPGAQKVSQKALGILGVGRKTPKALGLVQYGGSFPGAYLLRRALFLPFELTTVLDPALVQDGIRRLRPLDRLQAALTPVPANSRSRVATLESTHYLRNQLLRDADWAGMAHSLEIRTPLVDSRLLEDLAAVMPRLIPGRGKLALAAAPSRALPSSVRNRNKTGFAVPTGRWLAGKSANLRPATIGATSRLWALKVMSHFSHKSGCGPRP